MDHPETAHVLGSCAIYWPWAARRSDLQMLHQPGARLTYCFMYSILAWILQYQVKDICTRGHTSRQTQW